MQSDTKFKARMGGAEKECLLITACMSASLDGGFVQPRLERGICKAAKPGEDYLRDLAQLEGAKW